MSLPLELLTTPALCEDAQTELQLEIDDLTLRQANYDHRDGKATIRAADMAAEITILDQDITDLTNQLANMAADSRYRPRREAELRAAVKRRGDLAAALDSNGPVAVFRLAVDARQVAVQVAELNLAKAALAAHRASLPA
ncbi:hypothetical protein [Hymenobacter sp. B81]|uniref:hypothetical protein n=1 Tax=Hymenobacter sp. B81 TaxID=3344878 RepID=UPI0037DBF55A